MKHQLTHSEQLNISFVDQPVDERAVLISLCDERMSVADQTASEVVNG